MNYWPIWSVYRINGRSRFPTRWKWIQWSANRLTPLCRKRREKRRVEQMNEWMYIADGNSLCKWTSEKRTDDWRQSDNLCGIYCDQSYKTKCLIYNWSLETWLWSRAAKASAAVAYSIAGSPLFSNTDLNRIFLIILNQSA